MFIQNNQGFTCLHCGYEVKPHPSSSRNHCTECLYSLHVDIEPGDRRENCKGLMKPIGLEIKGSDTFIYVECEKCSAVKKNRTAPDDNQETITAISTKPIGARYNSRIL